MSPSSRTLEVDVLARVEGCAVVAILGTLKAGCAYVPVDVKSPAARVGHPGGG